MNFFKVSLNLHMHSDMQTFVKGLHVQIFAYVLKNTSNLMLLAIPELDIRFMQLFKSRFLVS